MVTLEYPLKDLYRRRVNTLAALTGLAVCVASIIFLLLMGVSMGLDLGSLAWRTSLGIRHMISSYLLMASAFSLSTGLLILVNVSFTMTEQRERDIGVMKAIGLAGQLGSFFVAEALLLSLSGCALGVLIGVASYIGCIRLMLSLGYALPFALPMVLIIGMFAASLLAAFAFSYYPLHATVSRLKAVEAISAGLSSRRVGVCIDPMNMGYTVYVPYQTLCSALATSGPNVVLVRVMGEGKEEAVASIGDKAAEFGLVVYDLSHVLERSVDFVQTLWSSVSILPSLALVSTALSILNYILVTTAGRISDLRVMRAVGARWSKIRGVILAEVLIIVLLGGPLGVVVGLAVSSTILTPYPTLPPLGVMVSSVGLLFGLLAVMCGTSLIAVERVLRRQIHL
ncbi:MAG: FtsX-like permease family protein [Candidatus Bathyarchaeia archaeon]